MALAMQVGADCSLLLCELYLPLRLVSQTQVLSQRSADHPVQASHSPRLPFCPLTAGPAPAPAGEGWRPGAPHRVQTYYCRLSTYFCSPAAAACTDPASVLLPIHGLCPETVRQSSTQGAPAVRLHIAMLCALAHCYAVRWHPAMLCAGTFVLCCALAHCCAVRWPMAACARSFCGCALAHRSCLPKCVCCRLSIGVLLLRAGAFAHACGCSLAAALRLA